MPKPRGCSTNALAAAASASLMPATWYESHVSRRVLLPAPVGLGGFADTWQAMQLSTQSASALVTRCVVLRQADWKSGSKP